MEHLGEMLVISPIGTLPTSLPSARLPGLYNCSFLFSSSSFSQPPSSCAMLCPLRPSHTSERHSQEPLTPLIPPHPLSTMGSSRNVCLLTLCPPLHPWYVFASAFLSPFFFVYFTWTTCLQHPPQGGPSSTLSTGYIPCFKKSHPKFPS